MEAFEDFITKIAGMTSGGQNAVRVYGVFHLCFLFGTVAVCVLLCMLCRNLSEKRLRVIITATGFALMLLEVYKQLVFTFAVDVKSEYDWSEFPLQLCSTPMYIAPFAGLMKNGKVRDMCMSYLATFSMIAGLIVLVFAGGVFNTPSLGVAVQTMVYHGGTFALGVLISANERNKLGFRYWLNSLPLFAALFAVAFCLNMIFYYAVPGVFLDLYFISPFYVTAGLPVATGLKTALIGAGAVYAYIAVYFVFMEAVSMATVYASKGVISACRAASWKKRKAEEA